MLVLPLILFGWKFNAIADLVQDHINRFNDLIKKYPGGEQPKEWRLMIPYVLINNRKCCGRDFNNTESLYYRLAAAMNCPSDPSIVFAVGQIVQ